MKATVIKNILICYSINFIPRCEVQGELHGALTEHAYTMEKTRLSCVNTRFSCHKWFFLFYYCDNVRVSGVTSHQAR